MHRRDNLAHFLLAIVVVLGLTLLMVCVEVQAQIAFMSQRAGNPEIYVMEIDGKNPRNLTNNPDHDGSPSWSPDGERIVFSSERAGNDEIYVMDADGGNQRRLTNNRHDDNFPSWSPNGERIAFMSMRDKRVKNFIPTSEIYVMDADGGNPQNLTNDLNDDRYPSWSPDGERILFSSQRDEHFRSAVGITFEIYVMDADGGNEQRLTNNRQNDWFTAWSPDGKRIAFSSDRKGNLDNFDIYVMDADRGNQRRLTNNPDYDWQPSWSPDGKQIAFSSDRDGNYEMYVMGANEGQQRNLTKHGSHDFDPAWYAPALAVAPASKILTMWGRLKRVDR